jgi:hypothetical protein
MDDVSFGQCIPWTLCPLDNASLGRCILWTLRPFDDAPPDDIPGGGRGGGVGVIMGLVRTGGLGEDTQPPP